MLAQAPQSRIMPINQVLPRFSWPSTRRRVRILPLLALLFVGLAQADPGRLPKEVQAALDKAQVGSDAFAAVVLPLYRPGLSWEHRADESMQPGSTMKLVTSIVALDRLSPTLRSRTDLLTTGPLEGDVLKGDVVLRGGADPHLGLAQVMQMLLELRESGVREISGDLVLDRSLFKPSRFDRHLPPFDESPEFPYNVIPDALQFAGNLMGLELQSTDSAVKVRTVPALEEVEFVTQAMTLTATPCKDWDDDWKLPVVTESSDRVRIELRGGFPRQCTVRAELQLFERDRMVGWTFRALWARLGGTWQGRVHEGVTPESARVVASHVAPPWKEVLRPLNKHSDNAHTRLLYLLLGVHSKIVSSADATTFERADREIRDWLQSQKIASDGLVLDNGSGLSRAERITPRTLALMLKKAHESRYAPDLLMSLPVAGEDGSMRNRLKNSAATGWARLKTGSLRNVAALAGIVYDPRRRPLVVVAMINHDDARKARPALDALVEWVARGRPMF